MMENKLSAITQRFFAKSRPLETDRPRDYFSQVFIRNAWGGKLSKSGPGSEGEFAKQKIELIRGVIGEFGISSILDFGCGDFFWMSSVAPSLSRYHGVDVVEKLIAENTRHFGAQNISFQCLDLSDPVEQRLLSVKNAGMLVCLDVFGHLLNREVDSLLQFILTDCTVRYFLVTNRRDSASVGYLKHDKTRFEGIDLEQHPLLVARKPERVKQIPGLYPNDFFDLYRML
jgi:hypothetical protein